MNLSGVEIYHQLYGNGYIKYHDDKYIYVVFLNEEKTFIYPDALNSFLTIVNKSIETTVSQNLSSKTNVEYERKIRKIIEDRKIDHLIHFTRLENLKSILLNGLVPVSIQKTMNITSIHNDEQRVDSKLDCTSCSIGFPNYRLFYHFRDRKYPGTTWVVLKLNVELLFSRTNIAYYCQTNASHVLPKIANPEELCTADAFENMFRKAIVNGDGKVISRESLKINDNRTTDPQAEILISDIIGIEHVDSICFQNQSSLESFMSIHGKQLPVNVKCVVEPRLYNPRDDYSYWQKEEHSLGKADLLYFETL